MGAAPRARQGEVPASAGAELSGLPGLPRFSSILFAKLGMRLCRPALRAALKGGRSPTAQLALALATPGLADGQGRRREVCALRS
jgi:hypothetical protein